jgi:copper chaperone NosL
MAGLVVGCGKPDISRPPHLSFGQEACAFCRMIISDERFAAATVNGAGETLKFDDVGCLIEHDAGLGIPERDTICWVRSFDGQGWLNAREATFVRSTRIVSPMNHGLAAFSHARAAGELANDPGSRSLRFSEMRDFVWGQMRKTASNSPKPE